MRRAPDRYSVEEAPPLHRSASEEQRRLADQLHRSHPPRTHSGLSALSVVILMLLLIRTGSVLCLLPFTNACGEKSVPSCIVLPGIIAAFIEPSRNDTANVKYNTRGETASASFALHCRMCNAAYTRILLLQATSGTSCHVHYNSMTIILVYCYISPWHICVGRACVHDCSADCQCQPACCNKAELCLTGKKRKSRQSIPGALLTPLQVEFLAPDGQ